MKLPIGIQDFVSLREDGYGYVDKTARIYELLSGSGKVLFLSRPRRFGKSLLCSTLGAIFEARRTLFNGLAIDSLSWEWKKYPVVRLDLNPGDYTRGIDELFITIDRQIELCARKYDVQFEGKSAADRFARLIVNLHIRYDERVAVIIDEYDKPLLSTIEKPELHEEIRNALKGFYGVLKSSDEHLKFVFLTGVTKFAKVSIFSDLNNITDISLDSRYCDLCGITQEELERDFNEEVMRISKNNAIDKKIYLSKLKHFYNGYRFSSDSLTVYNPFGLLNHFYQNGLFDTFWFETGTPTFLVRLIENQYIDILNLERKTVHRDDFRKYDAENMDAVPVLYQSGYLTIVDYNNEDQLFYLDYPNEEVRSSFAKSLLSLYIHASSSELNSLIINLPISLRKGDIDKAINALIPFFASIPYDLQIKQEKYYQTVVHLIFRMLGLYCQSEVKIADGRIDTLVETKNYVYCFEFKLDGTAEQALQQIKDKGYLTPWHGSGKQLFKVGINFDFDKRNIGEWKSELITV